MLAKSSTHGRPKSSARDRRESHGEGSPVESPAHDDAEPVLEASFQQTNSSARDPMVNIAASDSLLEDQPMDMAYEEDSDLQIDESATLMHGTTCPTNLGETPSLLQG